MVIKCIVSPNVSRDVILADRDEIEKPNSTPPATPVAGRPASRIEEISVSKDEPEEKYRKFK